MFSDLFSDIERQYLTEQRFGRLATIQPDGTPQVNPVGFTFNAELGTIDIGGFGFAASRKYRNVLDNGHAAFVVDDVVSTDPWRIRCLEVRGHAAGVVQPDAYPDLDDEIIRLSPRRIISFGIGDDRDPHELTTHSRDVGAGAER